jgi:hypothetical protein
MKNIAILAALFLGLLISCQKQAPELGPTLPPLPPPSEPFPIYLPCDTSMGVATAKKLTGNWKAGVICRKVQSAGKDYWVFELTTCTVGNTMRELLGFAGVPDSSPAQKFPLKKITGSNFEEGWIDPTYATVSDDGDVLEDYYWPDTTVSSIYFQIDLWDKVNKRAEGSFSIVLNIQEPRVNPVNPKRATFTSGKFWVTLPE